MASDQEIFEHLRREREWYSDRIKEVEAGTYPVERRVLGVVQDDRAGNLERFQRIVRDIDSILSGAE